MDLDWNKLDVSLSNSILITLKKLKFRNPTPVQVITKESDPSNVMVREESDIWSLN